MSTLPVDTLMFDFFDATVAAQIYDRWQHYTGVWNVNPGGQKAVDVVAVEPNRQTAWFIEGKDFRVITNPPKRSNIGGLAQTMAQKVRDSLDGLADAAINAQVASEKGHATAALSMANRRVVLHLEPHTGAHTALFPSNFSANVYQSLKQLLRTIDPNAQVLNIANTPAAGVPWTVS